jgi:hypothetical protein
MSGQEASRFRRSTAVRTNARGLTGEELRSSGSPLTRCGTESARPPDVVERLRLAMRLRHEEDDCRDTEDDRDHDAGSRSRRLARGDHGLRMRA